MKSIRYLVLFLVPFMVFADDQILVLSGGDNPGINNYSQYLQTKTMYDYLVDKNGLDNVTLFFGMGNNLATNDPFPDVHKINDDDVDVMIPGVIENNNPATKNNVYQYFFNSDTASLTSEDTLRMFVSDHGLPNIYMDKTQGEFSDNCIDLWNFDKTIVNNFASKESFAKVCMSKNSLSGLLNGVHARHIIFEMSQCFSGGFHQLSVTNKDGYPSANSKICGFTAAPPDHYASGCTANANGPTYQGYERSFTEWYTGISIPTGEVIRKPAPSMFSAHQSAILEDKTVDIPLSTSVYYLLQWADLFNNKDFKSRVKGYTGHNISSIFNHSTGYQPTKNVNYSQFKQLISSDQKLIMAKYPRDKHFANLSLKEQKNYIDNFEKRIATKTHQVDQQSFFLLNTLITNTVYPIWKGYIKDHSVPGLTSTDYKMENELYFPMIDNKLVNHPMQFKMLFLQYLAIHNNDPEVFNYNDSRWDIMESFAINKNLDSLANAVQQVQSLNDQLDDEDDQIAQLEQEKQLLKRIYLYKNALAAWATLIKINDKLALKDLSGLIECEHS